MTCCPNCGCKEHYQYNGGDDWSEFTENLERCAACGEVFDIADAAESEDEPS